MFRTRCSKQRFTLKSKFLSPNKKLGQHFLNSPKIIHSIVHSLHPETDAILEIGPGPGVLTEKIFEHKLPLFLIERDERFKPQLLHWVAEDHLILDDVLKVDFNQFSSLEKFHHWWVVSNLP